MANDCAIPLLTLICTLFLLTLKCVHRGLELDWDDDGDFFDSDSLLRCKAHDAKFEPTTGLCVKGPRNCAGRKKLKALEVSVDDDVVCIVNPPGEMLDFRKDFPRVDRPNEPSTRVEDGE